MAVCTMVRASCSFRPGLAVLLLLAVVVASAETSSCDFVYYTTEITMECTMAELDCTPDELTQIGQVIDATYDEVVNQNPELVALIHLDTQVCENATSTTTGSTIRTLFETPDDARRNVRSPTRTEHHQNQRDLLPKKQTYIWSGVGMCKLCSADSSDRRRLSDNESHDERKLASFAVIDFAEDGSGHPFNSGDYVRNQFLTQYGVTITVAKASGGGDARIFDTSKPMNIDDLGSPNRKCPGRGPGTGFGGRPGADGENCLPLGNVLIIQEADDDKAEVNIRHGELAFDFSSPTRVGHIGVLNILGPGRCWLEITKSDKSIVRIDAKGLGRNSVERIPVHLSVQKIKVVLKDEGAIAEIGLFNLADAGDVLSKGAQSYIDSNAPFSEFIPVIEYDLSYYLTRTINNYRDLHQDAGQCLKKLWVNIVVEIEGVPTQPTSVCWTQ